MAHDGRVGNAGVVLAPGVDRFQQAVADARALMDTLQESVEALRSQRDRLRRSRVTTRTSMHVLQDARDRAVVNITMPVTSQRSEHEREIWRMHVAYARRRDPVALARLVENYLPRTDRRARLATRRPGDLDDRTQVAREALVLALQRFDPSRRVPFEAFADATVGGQLRKHVRDYGWLVRAPRRVHELVPAIRSATERLTQELGRTPTPDEMARDLEVPVDDILMALASHDARSHQSLDALMHAGQSVYDMTGTVDPNVARIDEVDALRRALSTISEQDRTLVREYFVLSRTQQEIADRMGMSQMHVSRQLRRVVRLLAARIGAYN